MSSHRPAPHLRLEHASVRYPGARSQRPALQRIDLHVEGGEHVAVVGPSGAGKTTLLQVAACALRAHSGRVLLDGEDPWAMGSRRRQRLRGQLFLAPQSPPLPPRQRVVTAILAGKLPAMTLATSVRSLLYPIDIAGAHAALDSFDLADRLFDRVDRLSAGERQRVGLARALLAPARLWLVDEPLSSLDPVRAARALKTLRERAASLSITLVVSLHQVEMALANFPRVIGLRDGAVCFDAPSCEVSPEQLRGLYAHEPAQLAVGDDLSEQPDPQAPVPMHWR